MTACGSDATRQSFVRPTAPPTPVSFDSVPPQATLPGPDNAPPQPSIAGGPILTGTIPILTAQPGGDEASGGGNLNESIDPTQLALILSTPGPRLTNPTGPLPPSGAGRPSSSQPTPTLNFSSGQTTIASLRTSKVSFLFAYRQAFARIQQVQRNARLVYASADGLTGERVIWNFFFVWREGPKMWKVTFDAAGSAAPLLNLQEQAPSLLADVSVIDMNRVLDGDELLSRAEGAGLNLSLPVDIINFGVDGPTRLPCFIMTNRPQGKQVVINAYNGQIIRNDIK